MQIIKEYVDYAGGVGSPLIEAAPQPTDKPGFLYLKGLFLQGDTLNHNGRVYPRDEITRAVTELNERIAQRGPIPGELDHPEGLNMNFDRLSHCITEMHMEGSNGFGTIRVANQGLGLIIKGAVEMGVQVGVSSRGSGNVAHDGKVRDFSIVTIDAVLNPSAPNAFPTPSLVESMLRNRNGRETLKLIEEAQHNPFVQDYALRAFEQFLNDIRDDVQWRK